MIRNELFMAKIVLNRTGTQDKEIYGLHLSVNKINFCSIVASADDRFFALLARGFDGFFLYGDGFLFIARNNTARADCHRWLSLRLVL